MSGTDHHHLSEPEVGGGIQVAQIDSPVHIVALAPQELVVDSKESVAGSRESADLVR